MANVPGLRFRLDHAFTQRRANAVVDGELSAGAQRRAERHASVCPVCRRLLDTLRATVGALGGLRGPVPPGDEPSPRAERMAARVRAAARDG